MKSPAFSLCPQCHEPRLPHNVCPHCGTYKGKEIVVVEEEK
ncbi:MAG: 50S ribosomal protein L32 [Desulfobacterales bacterium]|nr:50S ribosomal protein L32 [Desulfobacterales bacterium]